MNMYVQYPQTLAELHKNILNKCTERNLAATVISSGDIHSNIAIVSSYPSHADETKKILFSGSAGNILWSACHKKGFNRANVYLTNVIKKNIDSLAGKHSIAQTDFSLYTDVLFYELNQLRNLEYILILGNEALQALCNHKGILSYRGSWLTVTLGERKVDALASIDPATVATANRILQGQSEGTAPVKAAAMTFNFDIHKFKLLTEKKLTEYKIIKHIYPTKKDALEFISACENSTNPISIDLETTNNETGCVGLGLSAHEAMCIPFIHADLKSYYSYEDELEIRKRLAQLYNNHKKIVAQNAMYEITWHWFKDRLYVPIYYDTLLAHHTLYPTLTHSLAYLCSRYTTHPYYKTDKDNWRSIGDITSFWNYNCTDCAITLAVQNATENELKKANLFDFFINHVMRLQPHLGRMAVAGIPTDTEYREYLKNKLSVDLIERQEQFLNAVHIATGDSEYNPNPRSTKDRSELYFQKLRLIGRGTSTDKINLIRMRNHYRTNDAAKAVIDAHMQYNKDQKLLSTYIETIIDNDNRMRCQYKQFGTTAAPGRLSSSKTAWNTGGNLQNIPSKVYPLYVIPDGYCFIYFDLAQAEARIVGWLAGIQKWIDDFERARFDGSFDCHRSLAADMYNINYDDVPKEDEKDGEKTLRFIAKRSRHGLNYRMQANKLAEVTGLTLSDATDAFRRYHKINPELSRWWQSVQDEAIKNKMLFNLYGRRWTLTDIVTDQTLESIVAFKPQSTIGDKVNRVIYLSEEDSAWPNNARCALNIHDAVISIAPIPKADHCLKIMKTHAEEALIIPNRPPLIIPADCKKTTKKTSWRLDDKGKIEFYSDEKGFHRWSDLEKISF